MSPYRTLVLVVVATSALMSSGHATTYTWTDVGLTPPGGTYGGGNWSDSTKWDTNGVPSNIGTADVIITLCHQGWPNYTVNPAALTPSTNNWSINSLTFINSGTQTDWDAVTVNGATSATLSIGAGGIVQNMLTTPYISAPVIATASQAWNINNFSGNYTGGLTIGGNLTLNNGVVITKNSNASTITTPPTGWFSGNTYNPTTVIFDVGTTTTNGTGAFVLAGGGFSFNHTSQYGRLGTNPLTITDAQNARKFLAFYDTASGTFANNISLVGGLSGSNSALSINYGNGSVDAGTILTFTGSLSGGIAGGATNGVGFINPQVSNLMTSDDRFRIVFQGDGSGLVPYYPNDWTYGNLHIAGGVVVLDNSNAMGTGNDLSFFVGANANSVTNYYCGLLATSGHNVCGHIDLRSVINGSNQHNPVVELGLSGSGSVTFSSTITLEDQSSSFGQSVQHLKLTAPSGGTAIFSGQIADASSNTGGLSFVPVTVLGGGTVKLSGSNNYNGTTSVRGGTLLLGNNTAMGNQTLETTTTVSLGDAVVAPAGGDVVAATTNSQLPVSGLTAGVLTFSSAVTTLDGVTLSTGNRVLYKDIQWNPERTGVYTVTDSTHWTRSSDLNTASAYVTGLRIHVTSGTINAGQNFYLYTGLVTPQFPSPVLGDTSNSSSSGMFLFNPDATSNTNVAILTDAALNISRNINVTNNLSTGQSILGGNSANASTFSGTISLNKNLNLTAAAGGTVSFSGDITGTNNVTTQGAGTVVFNSAKSYTGTTTVTSGTLEVDNTLASSAVSVNSGGTLQGTGTISNGVSISGTLTPGSGGGSTLTAGSASFSSGSTLAITVNGYGSTQLVTSGALNLNGALTVTLSGLGWAEPSYVIAQGSPLSGTFSSVPTGYAVTYTTTQAVLRSLTAYYYVSPTGSDSLNNGLTQSAPFATIAHAASSLQAGDSCQIGAGTYSASFTIPQATPANSRIAFQNNTGEIVNISGTVTLNNNLTLSALAGGDLNFSGDISGSSGIIKEGPGSAIFTGSKSYTGTTSVTSGTLTVNGSLASSAVTVSSGATLAGTGTITNGVSISGTISPAGTGTTGTLTVGSGTFATGGNLAVEINGTSNDKLLSTGALNLTEASLSITLIGSGWTQSSYVIAQGSPLTGAFATVPDGYAVTYTSTQATLISVPAFYVSPSGSDTANNGQSANAPFATISKAASVMQPGNTCYIRTGTYRETVTVPNSGSSTAPITFKAYNNETVIIDGSDPLTSWTSVGGNIWETPMSWTLGVCNQVFISNTMVPEARWPNANSTFPWQDSTLVTSVNDVVGGWSYVDSAGYDSNNQNGWLTDAQLPSRPNGYWNGATINMVSSAAWGMMSTTVTGYNDATKTITTNNAGGPVSNAYAIAPNCEYYITGIKGEMDSPGEWFYDPAVSKLSIYSTTAPAGVSAKRRSYGFDVSGKSNINIVGVQFFACSILSDSISNKNTYNGLKMTYLSHTDIMDGNTNPGLVLRNNDVLRNSELAWDPTALLRFDGSGIRVVNNYFHDVGYMAGGGEGMYSEGVAEQNLFSHNTLKNAGRGLMGGIGRKSIIEFNDMSNAMKVTNDGGVFYTSGEAGGTIFRYNMLHDAQSTKSGTGTIRGLVMGFYLDCQNSDWIIHHNIIWNIQGAAMQDNCRYNFNHIYNNTCWNSGNSLISSFPMNEESGSHVINNLFNYPLYGFPTLADVRNNIYNNTAITNSSAVNQGIYIPGITSGTGALYPVTDGSPDIGALEAGGIDWTSSVGNTLNPSDLLPTFSMPAMTFANQVQNSSFEDSVPGPLYSPWTVVGTGVTVNVGPYWNSWQDYDTRSGAFALKFTDGTTQVKQVVTGLLPNTRYKVYGGVRRIDNNSTVNLGVRNFGNGSNYLQQTATNINTPPPVDTNNDGSTWTMYNQAFYTGPTSTSAEIYLNVTVPTGGNPVYADDFCVEPMVDTSASTTLPTPSFLLPFNESSGTTAQDASPNSRNGTLNGGVTWVPGLRGNATSYNGTGAYVNVPGAVPATSLGSFTVSTWVKFDGSVTNPAYPTIMSDNNGAWVAKGWQIKCSRTGTDTNFYLNLYMWSDTAGLAAPLPSAVAPGVWSHVAFVVDRVNGTVTGYLNGVAGTPTTIPGGFTNVDTSNGTMVGDPTFKGLLDESRVDDGALSASQVSALATPDSTMLLHLQLTDSSGSAIAWDSSDYFNSGVLTNMNPATVWGGGMLSFSGNNGYVETPTTVPSGPSTPFTIATWVKFNDLGTASNTCTLASNNNDGGTQKGWQIEVSKTSPATSFNVGFRMLQANLTGPELWLAQSVPPGQWNHVAFVVDPTNLTVTGYLNGVQSSVTTIPVGFGDVSTSLGMRVGSGTLNGQLDDVRAYSRTLLWSEIANLAHNRTDTPPSFTTIPMAMSATAGTALTGSLSATDPDLGNTITFSKVSGPAWLNVANDGTVTGTPTLSDVGIEAFTVRATDSLNASTTAALNVTIFNNATTPQFTTNPIIGAGVYGRFAYSGTLAGTASDPNGTTLSYSKVSGPSWLTVASDGTLTGTPAVSDIGVNSFIVQATNPSLSFAQTTLQISVTARPNSPPSFSSNHVIKAQATPGSAYSGSLSGDATDPNGDTLTFQKLSGPSWLTIASNGALSGTPPLSEAGFNDYFIVMVSDGWGGSQVGLVSIQVGPLTGFGTLTGTNTSEYISRVQIANLDYTSGKNSGYNDFTSHTTVQLTPGQTYSYTLTPGFSSSTHNETWVVWIDYNHNGVFTDTGEAAVKLTTANSSARTGTFTVPSSATPGITRLRVAMARTTVPSSPTGTFSNGEVEDYSVEIGSAPTADAAPYFVTNPFTVSNIAPGSAISGSIASYATDWEGQTLTFTKVSGPSWLTIDSSGNLSGTPSSGNVGLNAFVIQSTDSLGASNTATLNVTVNTPPVFSPNPITASATQDSAFNGQLSAYDPDTGDTHTYAKISGPAWLSASGAGALSGTPRNADVGLNTFTVQVTDSYGATATATLNIAVANVNDPPYFPVNPILMNATTGVAFSGQLTALDPDVGDTQSYSILSGPSWLTVSPGGLLGGTPSSTDSGTNTFTVQVTDAANATANATVSVYVNAPPVFPTNPMAMSATRGTLFTGSISATDPGDTLTYSILSGPAWLGISSVGALSGTPLYPNVGLNTFVVQAVDSYGAATTATLNVTVINAASPPAFNINPVSMPSATQGAPYTGTLTGSANDPDGDTLTYSKVSGPTWLTVAVDGTLSGTPQLADVGANSFVIRVTDQAGTFATATLNINVLAAGSRYKQNNTNTLNLASSWTTVPPTISDVAVWDSTVTSANTVLLGADSSWQGIRILNPGGLVTLDVGNALTLGGSGIDMSSSTQNMTVSSNLNLSGSSGQTWNVAANKSLTVSGNISGSSPLIIGGGTGSTALAGSNTYNGTTTVNAGYLIVTSSSALGSPLAGTYVHDNAALLFNSTAAQTYYEPIYLDGTDGNRIGTTTGGSSAITLAGPIRLSGGVRLGLGRSFNFTGGISTTTVGSYFIFNPGGGTMTVSGKPFINPGAFTIDQGGILNLNVTGNITSDANPYNASMGLWASSLELNAPNAFSYGTRLSVGNSSITDLNGINQNVYILVSAGDTSLTPTIASSSSPATLTVGAPNTNDASASFDGKLTGSVSLTKIDTGWQTLSGISDTTGTYTVNGGTLIENFGRAYDTLGVITAPVNYLSTSSPLVLGGGTFQLKGRANGTASTPTGTWWNSGWTTIIFPNYTDFNALGIVPGQSVTGTGIPSGTYVVSVYNNGGNNSWQATISKATTAAGTLATFGGTTAPSSSQTFQSLTLNSGYSGVNVSANGAAGTALNLGAITQYPGGMVNFTLPSGTQSSTNGIITSSANINGILGGWATVGSDWACNSSGNIVAYTGYTNQARGSTIANSPSTNLSINSGTSGYTYPASTGTTEIYSLLSTGSNIDAQIRINSNQVLRIGSGGVLAAISSSSLHLGNESQGAITAGVGDNTPGTLYLINNTPNSWIWTGMITDNGTGSVSVETSGSGSGGSGGIQLSSANTYTGKTYLGTNTNGSFVSINADACLGTAPSNPVADQLTLAGGTLNVGASNVALNVSRGVTVSPAGGTLRVDSGGNLTVTGIMTGSGKLTKNGGGILTLASSNTHTGVIDLQNGTLALGDFNSAQYSTLAPISGSSGTLGFTAGTGTYNLGSLRGSLALAIGANTLSIGATGYSDTYTGVINGTGGLTKVGVGTLSLQGANTYSGDTLVSGGMLVLANVNALQNSTLNTGGAAGASVNLTTNGTYYLGGLKGSNDFDLANANLSVGSNNQFTTFNGALIGAFGNSLTKVGSGTLTLNGANTYTGATTVSSGTLSLAQASLNNTAGVTIAAGAVLNLAFTGTNIVGSLTLNGVSQPNGLYGNSNTGGLITGSGQLQVGTTLNSDHAPAFTSNPITGSIATVGTAYLGTLAGTATDVDTGNTLTFAKISGPAWLNVSADGYLTGTPTLSDFGMNTFTVRVYDNSGLSADATLQIIVISSNPDSNGNGILDAWEITHFGNANPGSNAATDQAAHDGLSNLIKYALGLDPSTPAINPISSTVVNVNGDQYLQITVPKNPSATNLTYTAETCSDLTTSSWASVPGVDTVVVSETSTQMVVRDAQKIGASANRFIRLKVVSSP